MGTKGGGVPIISGPAFDALVVSFVELVTTWPLQEYINNPIKSKM